jgi:4-amino-4-deoxy-L-arabinose transferase-like glycosyltransferase
MESHHDGSMPPTLPTGEATYAVWLLIALVGLLALALRLWGIAWGAPFIYHADEHYVLHRALDVVREHDLNPHWFQYPTLLIYVQALLILILQPFVYAPLTTNAALNGIGPWDALPEQWPFVLAGRLLVALMGVVGVVLLAQAGRRWHSTATGASAALLLAVLPLYVDSAHYLTTDVPAVMLIAATVWASLRAHPERMRAWFIAGACAGLAAGTKYTAGFVVLVPLVIASDLRQPNASLRRLMYVGAGVVAAFLIVCPYSLLDLENFLRGLDEQRQNYHAGSTPDHAWYWYLTYLWQYELQPGAAAAALVGVGFALHRGRRTDIALLVAPLCYFAVVATFPSRPERNILPLLPFACLFAGRGIVEIGTRVLPARVAGAVIAVIAMVALGLAWPPLGEAMRMNRERARPDTRSLAWQWVQTNLPAGTCVVREEYTPQLSAVNYRVVYIWSLAQRPYSWYLGQGCDHVIASSHIYNRVYNPPFIGGSTAAEFYHVLFTVPVVAEFTPGADSTGPTIRIFKLPRE